MYRRNESRVCSLLLGEIEDTLERALFERNLGPLLEIQNRDRLAFLQIGLQFFQFLQPGREARVQRNGNRDGPESRQFGLRCRKADAEKDLIRHVITAQKISPGTDKNRF